MVTSVGGPVNAAGRVATIPIMELGPVGIWSGEFRAVDEGAARAAAAELEELGFGALWIPGGAGGPILETIGTLLDATRRIVLATGILNVWMHDPGEVAQDHGRLTGRHPGRFLLGLGVSHAPLVESSGEQRYERPLGVMVRYLDALDMALPAVPTAERVLAALGPKMLELSAARSAGAHPYLVDPEHTAFARRTLGPGPLLAPEQKVVIGRDPATARAMARRHLKIYLGLPNYVNNLRRVGYTEEDVAGDGSDRLMDGIVAWGDVETVAGRVRQHLDAGADHVCIQILGESRRELPLAEWREFAAALPTFASYPAYRG
jgi:probable F420-dependent oxidoreductase